MSLGRRDRIDVPRPQWTSQYTRELVNGSLGGGAYAPSEMVNRATLLREFYAPFAYLSPGMRGLEACESPFTHLRSREAVTKEYLVRHSLGV